MNMRKVLVSIIRFILFVFIIPYSSVYTATTDDGVLETKGEATLVDFNSSFPGKKMVAVIGSGISGLMAAKKLLENGYGVVVFEKSESSVGVWMTLPNKETKLQTDSVIFSPVGETPIYKRMNCNVYSSAQDIARYFEDYMNKYNLKKYIQYGAEVLEYKENNETEKLTFDVIYNQNGEIKKSNFHSVWIRTGALSAPIQVTFPGEGKFTGTVASGIKGDLDETDFVGKNVVVIGMGPTAIESALQAVEGGASSVTILARTLRVSFSRKTFNHVVKEAVKLTNVLNFFRIRNWPALMALAHADYTDAGLEHVWNEVIEKHEGADALVWDGVPFVSDRFFLAAKHGLLHIKKGEISELTEGAIQTKLGEVLPVDILVKSLGYEHNNSILGGRGLVRTLFVEGSQGRVNHNLNIDRIAHRYYFGPTGATNIFPPVSYPLLSDLFDCLCLAALKGAIGTERFLAGGEAKPIDEVDMPAYIQMFYDVLKVRLPLSWSPDLAIKFLKFRHRQKSHNSDIERTIDAEWAEKDAEYRELSQKNKK